MLHNNMNNINTINNTRTTVFTFICATIILTTGLINYQVTQKKEELEEANEGLGNNVSELDAEVNDLSSDISELNTDIKEYNNTITKQQEKLKELKTDKEQLKKDNKKLNNTIQKKDEKLDGLVQLSNTSRNKSKSAKTTSTTKTMEVTAYTASCKGCSGITYKGTNVQNTKYHPSGYRIVAVDPNVVPLGTLIEVNGETYIADDIGSAIKGNRLDLLFSSKSNALQFGRQQLKVNILN
ncbi:hypothetical protein CIL05_07600 [Virgibacillus profundi]|uniref:3D domain-containing protein n=1 Tax=Virgibacillus profundi TaxID=2024555 RepID=A0A2A2IG79_9BACI|nr:3D domain-containing protein [Virgibacillus profundi]PAV30326.1 hypothetical protein CIL05_07600 [Virgibacillus profundi]PXY54498.1 hypothetical protein CIT14_07685 [Virgibacillus profundi]